MSLFRYFALTISQNQYLVQWEHTSKTNNQTDMDISKKSIGSFGLLVFGLVAVAHVAISVLRLDHVANSILGTLGGGDPQDQDQTDMDISTKKHCNFNVLAFGLVAVAHVAISVLRLDHVATPN